MTAKKKTTKKADVRRKAARSTPAGRTSARSPKTRARRPKPKGLQLRTVAPSLTVNDLDKSLSWYRDVLGFAEKERWEEKGALTGVELEGGNVTFYLSQDDWKKGRDREKGEGFRLYCSTVQDIDDLAEQIQSRGGSFLEAPHDESWGGRAFTVVDPDGFKITISKE